MIISKDLFIFGEHLFGTIIPEVAAQQQTLPLQQIQQQQLQVGEKTVDILINNKEQREREVEKVEEEEEEEEETGEGGSLSQQETVAVVIVAAAAAAAAAAQVASATAVTATATGKFATTNNSNKSNNVPDTLLAKEVEQNLELKENNNKQKQQQQQQFNTINGSIKPIKNTSSTIATTVTVIKREETGNIEGKKSTLQQKKKAKETEVYNKVRRPKEKLLVVATAEDNIVDNIGNGNKNITEEEILDIEEKAEELNISGSEPLVQTNLSGLIIAPSKEKLHNHHNVQLKATNFTTNIEDQVMVVANNSR